MFVQTLEIKIAGARSDSLVMSCAQSLQNSMPPFFLSFLYGDPTKLTVPLQMNEKAQQKQ